MVTERPLISVVMPVLDARPYLREAVASIQAQTYDRWELIVVDDGSTDGSSELAAELAAQDTRIRLLRIAHSGAANAVNVGAAEATGTLLARMDADDVALPERFAVQLAWMARTGVEVCGSCLSRFGASSGVLWFPEGHAAIEREMLFRHGLLQPTVLMPTAAFLTHRYTEGARFEGNALWVRLRRAHLLGNVPAVLVKHRVHARQTGRVHAEAMRAALKVTRGALFRELFPEAEADDLAAVDRAADREACTSVDDLERTGSWLARLGDGEDPQLRRRMLERWRATCRHSAPLGPAAYRAYMRIAPHLGLRAGAHDPGLRAACAARLGPDSRLASAVRWPRPSAPMRRRGTS